LHLTLEGYLALFGARIFCDSAATMLAKIYSAAVYGVDAYEVQIEVNGAGGEPVIVIVGLPDAAVKESRDRVTTAIANSGYYWPRGRTTINLAPADIKKEGSSFDLPIALGILGANGDLKSDELGDTLVSFPAAFLEGLRSESLPLDRLLRLSHAC